MEMAQKSQHEMCALENTQQGYAMHYYVQMKIQYLYLKGHWTIF